MINKVPPLFALVLAATCLTIPETAAGPPPALVFTQVPFRPGSSTDFLANRAADKGSRVVRLEPGGAPRVLTHEFFAAADPSVSFDGRRIVFAGRKTGRDPWDIWEMDADGTNKRQVTRGIGNCREPEYLAKSAITPPDFEDKIRWIVFVSDAPGVQSETGPDALTSLYVASMEPVQNRGQVVWRTTFNLSSDTSPTVVSDGRVIFTSRMRGGSPQAPAVRYQLLAANWDGSGLNLFGGYEQGSPFKTMAAELADRSLVFVESASGSGRGGRLARLSFRRPLRSYSTIGNEGGLYLNPRGLPGGTLAVSYSGGRGSYGLYEVRPEGGEPPRQLYDDKRFDDVDVQPLVPRPEPTGLISAVVDTLQWGELHCMNVYDSDLHDVRSLAPGRVRTVRFVSAVAAHGSPPAPQLMGTAPVEADGSFFVRLPGDTPFYMELLDSEGRVLRSMSRWLWVRKGTSRGCIGCHENRELAPENRVSDAVGRGTPHSLMPAK